MTSDPSTTTYRALQTQARATQRPTQELLELFTLEGFLSRLAESRHRNTFVLKGGVLLAAFGNRRPTRDVDLAGINIDNSPVTITALIRAILAIEMDDGLMFDLDSLTAQSIRDEDEYSGVRVSARAKLATAELVFHVDVNVGDPIQPPPDDILVPRILGGEPIPLRGYPIHMVLAEKMVTALQRGTASTRWRDFGDVWTLTRSHGIDGGMLQRSIATVAEHRRATVRPLRGVLDGYGEIGQPKWASWLRKQGNRSLPRNFAEVVSAVISFGDPVLAGESVGRTWDPHTRQWA